MLIFIRKYILLSAPHSDNVV